MPSLRCRSVGFKVFSISIAKDFFFFLIEIGVLFHPEKPSTKLIQSTKRNDLGQEMVIGKGWIYMLLQMYGMLFVAA